MNDELQAKIGDLKHQLENLEDTDPLYMGEELQYLRHKVLFVHARLEVSLDILIVKGLTNHLVHKTTKLENQFTNRKAQTILSEINFFKKIQLAKKLHQLKSPLSGQIEKVNTIRNKLSHSVNYQDEVRTWKGPDKYIEILEHLVVAMDGMNNLFIQFLPKK